MQIVIDLTKYQYNNIMALKSACLGRVPYKGIIMYAINAIKRGKALEQEPCRDMEEIAEVMKSNADAETKCKMISNILTAKPHYFEMKEPKESEEA